MEAVRAGLRRSRKADAIDATIAAAFVAFVAEPNNAGIGGYGHLSAFLPADGGFLTVDHSPRAPAAARPDMFELDAAQPPEGHDWPAVVDNRNWVGPLAVAIPGAVAGLHALHERAGRLPWARLLAPAIELADDGLEVTWLLLLEIAARYEEIRHTRHSPRSCSQRPAPARPHRRRSGERLNQRDLAATLRELAATGPDAFYRGAIAHDIAGSVAARAGILTPEDLAGYQPRIVQERPGRYRDLEYITALDTVGYETLGILEHFAGPARTYQRRPLPPARRGDGARLRRRRGPRWRPRLQRAPHRRARQRCVRGTKGRRDPPGPGGAEAVVQTAPWLPSNRRTPPSTGGVNGTTQVVAADRTATWSP